MTQEDWLLLEALVRLAFPVFLAGLGVAIGITSFLHGGED